MPIRLPPFVLEHDPLHRVNPLFDVDWTLCPRDERKEQRLRDVRSKLVKDMLLQCKEVAFRSSGNSLKPRVCSKDRCMYVPVRDASEVEFDDIVLFQPQPKGYFNAHIVASKWW